MDRKSQVAIMTAILAVAAWLRLTNVDWDVYNHYHPDERYISWVAVSIEAPAAMEGAFEPHKSTFNPFYWPANPKPAGVLLEEDQPRRFAYGHVPLYLGVIATRIAERIGPGLTSILPSQWLLTQDILNAAQVNEYRHLTAIARALTGLVDVLNVVLVFLIGKWLYRPAVGLLAATFLTLNVMHIQLAHFFAVDPYLTFFVLLTMASLILALQYGDNPKRQNASIFLAATATGLAVGSKFTGILLFAPLAVTILWGLKRTDRKVLLLGAAMLVSFISFALTNPFAIIDATCEPEGPESIGFVQVPESLRSSCYLQNVISQGAMVRGTRDVPFVRQYLGTEPFTYYGEMQLKWGMGPALGVVAFAGLFWAAGRGLVAALKRYRERNMRRPKGQDSEINLSNSPLNYLSVAEVVVLAWTIPFFLSTGSLQVKFMRYLQPLVPFLMIYGAAMLMAWSNIAWRQALIGAIVAITGLFALAFTGMYGQPHPWIEASRWIYKNVEPDASILNEVWDDALPDGLEIDGVSRARSEYQSASVNWLSGIRDLDNEDKLRANLILVAGSDYVILTSNRNYGVIPRLPDLYPLSSQYYPLLFGGQLGFELAYTGSRMPNIVGLHLKPDAFEWPVLSAPSGVRDYFEEIRGPNWGRFDESFTVYDQPLVMIFKNIERKTEDEMISLFARQDSS